MEEDRVHKIAPEVEALHVPVLRQPRGATPAKYAPIDYGPRHLRSNGPISLSQEHANMAKHQAHLKRRVRTASLHMPQTF
jgi:hypothetical protein